MMNATKTRKVTAGITHQRSPRSVLTPIRARVGPFTPVEPRVSVDAIASSAGRSHQGESLGESAHSGADVKGPTPSIENVFQSTGSLDIHLGTPLRTPLRGTVSA